MTNTLITPAPRRARVLTPFLKRIRRRLGLFAIFLFLALAIPADGYLGTDYRDFLIRQAIGRRDFEFVSWEVQALAQKVGEIGSRPGKGLDPRRQSELVVAYLTDVRSAGRLSDEIERIHADRSRSDGPTAAATLQEQLRALRTKMEGYRPAVEEILEAQVSAVLAEEGFAGALGVFPPVLFQFTASPNLLIISPRDRIVIETDVHLDATLDIPAMERIEERLAQVLEESVLIEGTGGVATYPTMVLESSDLEWILDTIAHEWSHTYLAFRPLGFNYFNNGQMRTINETVASIIGGEISERALERFYPERVRPSPWPRPLSMRPDWLGSIPDHTKLAFGPFMRATRLEVDRLLAQGRIDEAEKYMEARRGVLVEEGYSIRKLNQAYFAFHGSYAVGSAATDPIGGKLRTLRLREDSLAAFVALVARFNDPADLDAAFAAPNSTIQP